MPLRLFARWSWLSLILILAGQAATRAEIIYDNSSSGGGTNVFYAAPSVLQYGDEAILGGTSRAVSQFLFEYFGDFIAPQGDEMARIRLYKADGPLTSEGIPTPGTILYDSGLFSIGPGYITKKFSGLNINVPGVVIWTISFEGLTGFAGDRAGLIFWPEPTVGKSYDDFWQQVNAGWELRGFNGRPKANFVARIITGGDATTLAIRRETNKVIVEWTGLSILQVSDKAAGPYIDLPNVRNRYEINPNAAPMKFWRLRD